MNAALQTIIEQHDCLPDTARNTTPVVRLVPCRSSNGSDSIFTRLKCDGHPKYAPDYLLLAVGIGPLSGRCTTYNALTKLNLIRNH